MQNTVTLERKEWSTTRGCLLMIADQLRREGSFAKAHEVEGIFNKIHNQIIRND